MRKAERLPPEMIAPFVLDFPNPLIPHASTDEERAGSVRVIGNKPLDWNEVFGNTHPVEIEVGFGKGLFLLNASAASADVNFLGIEKERKYMMYAATRLAKRNRTNVKVVCADARWFIKEWIGDASVQTVHIYFPDPWWKKRHHKRRLFNDDFADHLVRILRPGGRLSFATDVPEYYAETMPMLRAISALIELPPPEEPTPAHDMDYLTNFERKFRKQAKPILRALLQKKDYGISSHVKIS